MATTHKFGGTHTEIKLDVLRRYISAYKNVMKNQNFCCRYIDAFAGSGERQEDVPGHALLNLTSEIKTYPGSVQVALDLDCFSTYLFIEPNKKRYRQLCTICKEYSKKNDITIKLGDANKVLQQEMEKPHQWNDRGVVFLDPYGMEVNFDTLELISKTKKYDVLYLFPYSGLYRNLQLKIDQSQQLEAYKVRSICTLLGLQENDLLNIFYQDNAQTKQGEMFDNTNSNKKRKVKQDLLNIAIQKLNSIFAYISNNPIVLETKQGDFALLLMVSNTSETAIKAAERIYSHIKKLVQYP